MSVVLTERSARLRTRLHRASRRLVALSLVVGGIGLPLGAAADCGDDINGRRVACACGDVVVASVRLQPDDPILGAPCGGDGLVVRPPASGGALVIEGWDRKDELGMVQKSTTFLNAQLAKLQAN